MGMKFNRFLFSLVVCCFLVGCNFSSGEDEKSKGEGNDPDPFALVEGEWADGNISKDGQTNEYTIKVTEGTQYFVYLNTKNVSYSTEPGLSSGTSTGSAGRILASAKLSYSDGTAIDSTCY